MAWAIMAGMAMVAMVAMGAMVLVLRPLTMPIPR
jgi:hypothetical protein